MKLESLSGKEKVTQALPFHPSFSPSGAPGLHSRRTFIAAATELTYPWPVHLQGNKPTTEEERLCRLGVQPQKRDFSALWA